MVYILYIYIVKGEDMNNNLKKIEKELRSFAKRCKEIKYTHAALFAFLFTGFKEFKAYTKVESIENARK